MEGNAYLVATNEMLPEKNQIGQRQRGTSIPSAASVVNFNNQRSRIDDQKFGFSDDLFIDHCLLLFERRADAGNRIEVTTVTGTNSPVTTYFLVDTQTQTSYSQVIEQSTTPGTPTVSYVWGLNLIAQNNAVGTTNAGTYYFIVDGHGSTVALTDANGNVVQTFHYDGFGNALGFTPSTAITQYLYTQQYHDLVNNTYYDWARNYDPATGLFDQADYGYSGSLANPMTDLPYAFTGGDPINMSDLNGHGFSIPDVLASISIMTAIVGIAPVAGAGLYSLKAGLPDALAFGGFFEADLSGLPGGAVMSRALVGAEISLFPRAGEAQVSLFGPLELELNGHPNANTVLQWLSGRRSPIGFEAGAFQAWYWGMPRPSPGGLGFGLGFLGYELGAGILAGAEIGPGASHGMFAGFTFTPPNPGGFAAGGAEYNFPAFHMSETAMISVASAGEGLFTFGLGEKFAGALNLGGLTAAVVDGGLAGGWVGWTYA